MTQPATKSPDSPATISDRSEVNPAASAAINLANFAVTITTLVEQTYHVKARDRIEAKQIGESINRIVGTSMLANKTVRSNLPTTVTQL